jgi:hypothetical protein
LFLGLIALVLLTTPGSWQSAADVPGTPLLDRPAIPSPTPGLLIRGHVWLDSEGGPGLPGAKIYRRYAGYDGTVVATTGADGSYESEFWYIPTDETITVWAERAGYGFDPNQYYWRHYYGYREETLNFVATQIASRYVYLPVVYRPVEVP